MFFKNVCSFSGSSSNLHIANNQNDHNNNEYGYIFFHNKSHNKTSLISNSNNNGAELLPYDISSIVDCLTLIDPKNITFFHNEMNLMIKNKIRTTIEDLLSNEQSFINKVYKYYNENNVNNENNENNNEQLKKYIRSLFGNKKIHSSLHCIALSNGKNNNSNDIYTFNINYIDHNNFDIKDNYKIIIKFLG